MNPIPSFTPGMAGISPSETADDQLIRAVETREVDRARGLLAKGASPNARKRVRMVAKVRVDGGEETRSDTVEGESALALAIIFGHVQMVQVLLAAGADPNAEISWKICTWKWPQSIDHWNNRRWNVLFVFPSALALAIGRAGKVTDPHDGSAVSGRYISQSNIDNKGVIHISKRNGQVTASASLTDQCDEHTIVPRIDIVRALLAHGARVDSLVLAAAGRLDDREFRRVLEEHREAPAEPRAAHSDSTWSTLVAEQMRRADDAQNRAAQAEARAAALEVRLAAAEARATEDRTRADGLQAQVTTLLGEKGALQANNTHLTSSLAAAQTRLTAIEASAGQLAQRVGELDRENAVLRHRLASTTPSGPGPAAPAPAQPTATPVGAVLFAAFDYDPAGPDEVQLRVGQRVFCELKWGDGWGKGYNITTSATGVFPMACLSATESPPASGLQPNLARRAESRLAPGAFPAQAQFAGQPTFGSRGGTGPSVYVGSGWGA